MIELTKRALDEFAHRRNLRRLQREVKRSLEPIEKRIEEAEDPNEGSAHASDYFATRELFDYKIRLLQMGFLLRKAEIYLLPTPPFDPKSEDWEECLNGKWALSLPALAVLREAIDDYERKRRDRIQSWFLVVSGFVGAITGAVGALIGLIAISG